MGNNDTNQSMHPASEEELFLSEVIAGDAELYLLDCYLAELLRPDKKRLS